MNASFAVGVTRPFVLTRSTFIIHGLVELLGSEERLASRVVCVGKPPIADLTFAAKDARIVQRYLAETKPDAVARLECQTLDVIDDTEHGFERVEKSATRSSCAATGLQEPTSGSSADPSSCSVWN